MKTILLLGGYGFIGTNIMKYIDTYLYSKFRVIVFDRFLQHPYGIHFNCIQCSYAGDFSDGILMEQIFSENKIDMVIHSLSTTIPMNSMNARYDVESNLLPTLDLLSIMCKHNVMDMVYISSGGAIYGDVTNAIHKEDEDVFPISSYGIIKLSIEKYLMQYAKLYGLKPLILRLSNPYGKYHYSMKQGICNVAVSYAMQKRLFTVYGDGHAQKDYIYIGDFVNIMFKLILKNISKDIINIGSQQIHSVNDILHLVRLYVPDFVWEYKNSSQYDVNYLQLNTEKLHKYIGDYEFMSLDEGIKIIVDWKKENKQE